MRTGPLAIPFVPVSIRSGDPVEIAAALVRIPSVNPALEAGGSGEAEAAAFCADLLTDWGFRARVVEAAPGRPNVVAEVDGEGPTLLLNGHLDTVGVASMRDDPFSGTIVDGKLHGRGACDMKGGVGAILGAAYGLARAPKRPPLIVALTADEEHESLGMVRLIDEGVTADCAVVCEPTGLRVMPAHKGFVWAEASFRGRPAHGSRPDLGIDAIRHAALFVTALDDLTVRLQASTAHPILGHGSLHCGTIRGGSAPSVYPDTCTVVVERRTLPTEGEDRVLEELREVLHGLGVQVAGLDGEIRSTLVRPGSEVSPDASVVRTLRAVLAGMGMDDELAGMSAWVDAAYLNERGIPAVCFGPGSIELAHADVEWAPVEEIRSCARTLEAFALALAGTSARP